MLRTNSTRRVRPRFISHLCAATSAAVLLLLSLFVLHSRLSSSSFPLGLSLAVPVRPNSSAVLLPDDAENDSFDLAFDDRIDVTDEEEVVEESEDVDDDLDAADPDRNTGGYYWDHVMGVERRGFGRGKMLGGMMGDVEGGNGRKVVAFSSDDLPVDEKIRVKLEAIDGVEDALLVKAGRAGLRKGWARWFEAKGRFLRGDKMFGSSLEAMNPMNHPLLQDPDVPGGSVLTRGDKLLRKAMWKEMEKIPFGGDVVGNKRVERRALVSEKQTESKGVHARSGLEKQEIYPDGRRWGYYPGFDPHLSFSAFMDKFLSNGQCSIRAFMVWNSPSWSYGVRHQRGLESFFHHHKDACVVMFSEMMELNFFQDFVKDGFKIAVAMPNLDELLEGTPLRVFASLWNEWRKTKYYSIHYSELIRLAALYRYGGIYLDSDLIILKSLTSIQNFIGLENKDSENPIFNGAVMAFEKHSPFILECMKEFYSTYDDTKLRWNGPELFTRVLDRLSSGRNKSDVKVELKVEDPHIFFPISSQNITRYFAVGSDDLERNQQEVLFKGILDHSKTFHFWHIVTSAMVPEQGSLVERLINHHCLYCLDVL